MRRLTIYKDNYVDATAVSNIFIDEYMKDANDAQLKIYIYLIRMMNANLSCSLSDIADKFNHTEKDVMRALKYWEKNRLLSLEYDEARNLIGIHLLDLNRQINGDPMPAAPAAARAVKEPVSPDIDAVSEPASASEDKQLSEESYERPSYSLDQLKEFKSKEETSQLLFIVEQYIGKTLSPSEVRTIFFISDKLAFSVDLIDYLVQYCVERGKKDFRYIEKVAVSWAQSGITNPKDAEKYAYKYDKSVYDIMNALGKNTSPTSKEADYVRHWTKELDFDMDVIRIACERTVMGTDKHRFEYADTILKSWHNAGVHHLSDIAKEDEKFLRGKTSRTLPKSVSNNAFNQFKQHDYDFETLEKELLKIR